MSEHLSVRTKLVYLGVSSIITILLYQYDFGEYLLYPFTILATWFHEMAHGIAALLVGFDFVHLKVFSDGSGYAKYVHPVDASRFLMCIVSAAGPMAGPIVGSFLIIVRSFSTKWSRICTIALGSSLLLSVLVYVRGLFGILSISIIGAIILFLGARSPHWFIIIFNDFLGTQICISIYHQVDYLFIYQVEIDGKRLYSDTGYIQNALLLPYWFWGSLMVISSLIMLIGSLYISAKRDLEKEEYFY